MYTKRNKLLGCGTLLRYPPVRVLRAQERPLEQTYSAKSSKVNTLFAPLL